VVQGYRFWHNIQALVQSDGLEIFIVQI